MSYDDSGEDVIVDDTVKWAILGDLQNLQFVGKDVFAVHDNLHIYFFNTITKQELIYNATNSDLGDGIQCFAGHRTVSMFVFSEISKSPRLFLLTYPDFSIVRMIRDDAVSMYASVALTELEQIVALSGYPNYLITVWCWRTNKKLVSCETGVKSPDFFFKCSLLHNLFFHGWNKRLCVWEIVPCYKLCMMLDRRVHGNIPDIVDATWSPEGNLFCIDKNANVYLIQSESIGMIAIKEYSSLSGPYMPMLCYYKGGLVIYGPELLLKHLSKVNKQWTNDWSYTPNTSILKMVTDGLGEMLLIVMKNGSILKLNYEQDAVTVTELCCWQRKIRFIGILNPFGDSIVTVNTDNRVCVWSVNGQLLSRTRIIGQINFMACSPVSPLIALCVKSSEDNAICIMQTDPKLRLNCLKCLTDEELNFIVWSASGNELVTSALSTGQIFFLKLKGPQNVEVINMVHLKSKLVNGWTVPIGKEIYFMALALKVNVYTNIPEKILVCYDFLTTKSVAVYGRIDPMLTNVIYLEKNLLIGVNLLPKDYQVFSITLEEDQLKINCDYLKPLDHEISGLSINKDRGGIISWGMDGFIYYQTSIFNSKLKYKVRAKHYLDEDIKFVIFDPQQRYAISLTYYGSFTMHNLTANNPPSKSTVDSTFRGILPNEDVLYDIFRDCDETWIQTIEDIKEGQEKSQWADLRNRLDDEFDSLQEKVLVLLEDNISAPPLHQLPLNIFNLHVEAQLQRAKDAAVEREKINSELGELIKSQDKVTDWIKVNCWDTMHILGTEVHAIFSSDFVENYALYPITYVDRNEMDIIENFRRIESMKDEHLFKPWEQAVSEIDITKSAAISTEQIEEPVASEELKIEPSEKSFEKFIHQLSGSSAHLFITPMLLIYPQMLTQTNFQMRLQMKMTEQNIIMIKQWFNKQFDDMMGNKQKELSLIREKNRRLNVIVSELNTLFQLKESEERISIYISDPQWAQEEIPPKLVTVEEDEVGITPYVSPSQVVILPPDLGPKDDFRERALMYMMDGVLEKLWHEEIKKPIPKPQCMLTKEPEDFTEDDLKVINEWEKNVELRNEEREKYRKMLRIEYAKLATTLNEQISRFNQRLRDFILTKLKVESAIGQEDLKLMRMRVNQLVKIERVEKSHELEFLIRQGETDHEQVQKEIHEIQVQSTECHAVYETLSARDRTLDKNFKASFSDVSSIVADLCYKLFKKRPKWQQRASMTAGVLYEMAHACLVKEKPPFLHPDCHEFLKGLDQLDLISNMPPVMDEVVWTNMCKLRRIKIDNEIKIRAICAEIAEVEAANNTWQKRSLAIKNAGIRMRHELTQLRSDIEYTARNVYFQLVMKSGFVEIETSGHEEDFYPAVLIKLEDIDAINTNILEAGQMKLKAMRATTSFKKHILSMEWEHAKLKMKIRHLEQDLYHLERIKVTKEIQKYMQDKTKKSFVSVTAEVDRQVEITRLSFNNQLYNSIHRVEELEMKVGQVKTQILRTDDFIGRIKIRVSEKHHSEDPVAIKKKMDVQASRMEALVLRSKLLNEVQKQYMAIVLLQTELELQRLRTFPTLSVLHK